MLTVRGLESCVHARLPSALARAGASAISACVMADRDQLSFCAEQLRSHDHDRFLTCLFAPSGAREDLFALYAFNLEIAKVAEVVSEPMAGQIRIQWWREALDGLYAGAPRKHQVAVPLSEAVRRHELTRELVRTPAGRARARPGHRSAGDA